MSLRNVAIVGIATTEQAFEIDREPLSLCLEAAIRAVSDAGLVMSDIDGLAGRWPGPGGTALHPGSPDWSTLLGIPLSWVGDSYPAGVPALLDAAAAISAGYCNTVLVVGGQSRTRVPGSAIYYTRPDNEFTAPYGSYTAAQFALIAQRYFHQFRAEATAVARVAADIRNMGSVRPDAVMSGRGPYTLYDVLASPKIVEPFHLLEVCLASEGAAAFVVTRTDMSRDCKSVPIKVLGGGLEWARQQYVDPPMYQRVGNVGAKASKRAFGMAGVAIDDVDVFELYDATAFEVIRQIEVLGLCGEGEGCDLVMERGLGVGPGQLPINTDGGLLSYGHLGWSGPTLKVIEAVRQLRHEAASSQVSNAEVALISAGGAGAQYFNLALLGRA